MTLCNSKMSFQECELTILRAAVDKSEYRQGRRIVDSPSIVKIMKIVDDFIKTNNLICYGGLAINNILPKADQFYDKSSEVPDYDFFSPDALNHAKQLADIYAKKGFNNIEAKAGQHYGTYKVFVDFIPVADVTMIPNKLYNTLLEHVIIKNGMNYAPVNYLRMGMYLELSRPEGDVGRWEKVMKRLLVLNKNFPLNNRKCNYDNFIRTIDDSNSVSKVDESKIHDIIINELISKKAVFFGGYALSFYNNEKIKGKHGLDFDIIVENNKKVAEIIKDKLIKNKIKNATVILHHGIGELLSNNYEVKIGNDTVAFLYEPVACHSYNTVQYNKKSIRIATIDTMMSYYLAFLYANKPYHNCDRLLCMANFLFDVQNKNRLAQQGVLRRFSISCIGHQETIKEMRRTKSRMHKKLAKSSNEYEEWFLKYTPRKSNKTIKTKLSKGKQKTQKNK